jgi:hypothetical protein
MELAKTALDAAVREGSRSKEPTFNSQTVYFRWVGKGGSNCPPGFCKLSAVFLLPQAHCRVLSTDHNPGSINKPPVKKPLKSLYKVGIVDR